MAPNISEIQSIRKDLRCIVREFGFFKSTYETSEASHGETHALIELQRLGELEVGELARLLNMEKSVASKLSDKMLSKSWIETVAVQDARKKVFRLSRKGQQFAADINSIADIKMRDILSELDTQGRDTISSALASLADAVKRAAAKKKYVIRKCCPKDDRQIASIVKRALKDLGFAGPGTAATDQSLNNLSAFNAGRQVYYVADRDGKIEGGCGIIGMEGEDETVCELVRMFLHPDARGSGIGQLLLSQSLHSAQEFGYKICYLETTEQMKAAQKLYVKNGFKYIKKRRGNTGHFACNVFMQLAL